ncbi:MAG: prepilin peptidase [Candidatus Marinimicrobia bacterium]|nr:prepilin peptidase [Candidatus Neomarinimicrobiota bacterium]
MLQLIGVIALGIVFAILSNTTIDQTPKKRAYTTPSPYCPSCATKLSWKDMLPFWSFIRSKGKCPYCQAPLPLRHIIVDITELAWVTFYILKFGWSYEGSMALIFGMSLIIIILLLNEKRELNDSMLVILGMLAVINFLAYNPDRFPEAALSMILGTIALAVYNLAKIFATDDSQFELTELKLGALLGLFLGIELGLVALFFALTGGAVIGSINIKFFNKTTREAVPQFAMLMVGAGLLTLLWGQDILTLYQSIVLR